MILANTIIMYLYYAITLFFGAVIVRNFVKTKNVQDAVLYGIILMPFVLRVLHLK
ncbi:MULTISPECIES: hypothetical protein [Aminobacterium]|jgi:uncharacterized membrane protein YcfT|uniref:hypothetical protein n=1 Tax=Aminobacterium TaxID=81466 RepID=UPI0004679427|nr:MULTISPECIES: hypothetical protein [Aminobacterium]